MSDALRIHNKAVHEQLLAIRSLDELTPEMVLDAARPKSHPLHSYFEWNNSVAAEKYRLTQASGLIRSVRAVYAETPEGEERKVRVWSSVGDRKYKLTEDVLKDDFGRKLLLQNCNREIAALKRKYGHLEEFAEILLGVLEESA